MAARMSCRDSSSAFIPCQSRPRRPLSRRSLSPQVRTLHRSPEMLEATCKRVHLHSACPPGQAAALHTHNAMAQSWQGGASFTHPWRCQCPSGDRCVCMKQHTCRCCDLF